MHRDERDCIEGGIYRRGTRGERQVGEEDGNSTDSTASKILECSKTTKNAALRADLGMQEKIDMDIQLTGHAKRLPATVNGAA